MKKKNKSGVAKELFKSYFVGYIGIFILTCFLLYTTIIMYLAYIFLPATLELSYLNNKLVTDYNSITDEDLADVDGFLIKVQNDNSINYKRGNVIEDFEVMTLENYFKIFYTTFDKINSDGKIENYTIKFLESMLANIDLDTSVIKSENGSEYSISYRYLEAEDAVLIFGMPYEHISMLNDYSSENKLVFGIVKVVILNILIVVFILYKYSKMVSKKFVKPIEVLNTGMNEICRGNYGEEISIEAKNEFKDLADGFNLMSVSLKEEKEENERLQQERNKLILHISHDLKNPLASVLGYSDVITRSAELSKDETAEYLNIIRKNSERANKIITDLFDFSLLDSSDYKLNTKQLDINELMREIVAYHIPELEEKEFDYEFDIKEEEVILDIDEVKLTRAISNLIDNSIKYNSKGTKLKISTKTCNNKFEIIIADEGKGISEEVRNKIFEAFVREDKARNTASGGTGLGLAITKAIIEKHNGIIELQESTIGTSFKIEFNIV